MMKMRDLCLEDRSLEKLARYGTVRLGDLGLLKAIIGRGNARVDVDQIARDVLKISRQKGGDVSCDDPRGAHRLVAKRVMTIGTLTAILVCFEGFALTRTSHPSLRSTSVTIGGCGVSSRSYEAATDAIVRSFSTISRTTCVS